MKRYNRVDKSGILNARGAEPNSSNRQRFCKGLFLSNDAALKQCQKTVRPFHWNGRTVAFPGGKAMDQLS
ncbi:MAG: hypothetical protein LIO60_01380, partial [Oscillospiraceae bacterium]|nr:hypothetical protein [Oscillospiraceae bacterium]